MPAEDTERRYRAVCHHISDDDNWPVAKLMVYLSRNGEPNRAELYFNSDLIERYGADRLYTAEKTADTTAPHVDEADQQEQSIEDIVLRTAHEIFRENYSTSETYATKLEVRLLSVVQHRPTEFFDLTITSDANARGFRWDPWLITALGAVLMIMIGIIWGFSTLFSRSGFQGSDGLAASTPIVVEGSSTDSSASSNGDSSLVSGGNAGGQPASPDSSTGSLQADAAVDPSIPQTNGLPPSSNANNNLRVGQRIRVVPGAALTLRTQPGANAGEEIGFMQNAQQATIIGGPYWLQGLSDTIVWWFIELDNGTKAWAPANDSQFTVLEPAPRG